VKEVEEDLHHNQLHSVFRAIKTLTDNTLTSSPATVHKKDGSPCSSTDETLQRWAEHFEAALNYPSGSPDQSVDNESISAVAHTGVHIDEPKLD